MSWATLILALVGAAASVAAARYARGPYVWMREERARRAVAEQRYREILEYVQSRPIEEGVPFGASDREAVDLGVRCGTLEVFWPMSGPSVVRRKL